VTRLRLRRIFWVGAAAILVVAALIALGAIVRGDFSETDGRILVTLAALLYAGGAALAGLALVDRGTATRLGWIVAVAAPVGLAFMAWGVWSFVFESDENVISNRLAWSSVIALAAGLIATTAILLTQRSALLRLAVAAGGVAAFAAVLSIVGVWAEPDSDAFVKALAALWILAALAYFLVPVLQRFTAAGARKPGEIEVRVLAVLGDIELVASDRPVKGVGVEEQPRAGEWLTLRRRADA
jgi:hypothetical protein